MISTNEILLRRLCTKNFKSILIKKIDKTFAIGYFYINFIKVLPFSWTITSKYLIVLAFDYAYCMCVVLCKVPERETVHRAMDTLIVYFNNFY